MNTNPPTEDKPESVPPNDQVIHKHRKMAKARAVHFIDPRLLEEAEKSAQRHGYKSVSELIEGHLLLGLIWDRANPGKIHVHTPAIINDPEQFEKEMRDILTNPPKDWGSWIAHRVEENTKKPTDATAEQH